MNKQFQDLLNKYPQILFYYPDKNMIYWEEIKTTTELNNDISKLLGDSSYVKIHNKDTVKIISDDLECELELYKRYEHYGCSCDIMIVKEEDQLCSRDGYVDLMYEGGLWTFESLNDKDCICIYLNE